MTARALVQPRFAPSSATSRSVSICASLRTRWRLSMNAASIEMAVPGSPSAAQASWTSRRAEHENLLRRQAREAVGGRDSGVSKAGGKIAWTRRVSTCDEQDLPASPVLDPLPDLVSELLENADRAGGERVRKPLVGIGERSPKMDRLDAGHLVLSEKLDHVVRA
jgi:hypothetical protein